MNKPTVSVITPSYNHAPYIRATIESVLAQDYPHVEHIVVDGASTDGTVEILREYGERYPDRFRWLSEPDKGQSDAFNKGLALARGVIVGWQNSDDYYMPRAVSRVAEYLFDHPDAVAVYGDCEMVNEAGRHMSVAFKAPFDYRQLLRHCCISNQAAFIRRSALEEGGGLAKDLQYAMDYDLWLRLGLVGRLVYLPGVLGAFRHLSNAKSAAGFSKMAIEDHRVVTRIVRQEGFPQHLLEDAARALHTHGLRAAVGYVALDQGDAAVALLRDAAQDDDGALCAFWLDKRLEVEALATESLPSRISAAPGYVLRDHPNEKARQLYHDRQLFHDCLHRLLRVLPEGGDAFNSVARTVVALLSLSRALDPVPVPSPRYRLSYGIRALQLDRSWLRHRSGRYALRRAGLGNRTANTLSLLFGFWRGLRYSILDHLH